jgi:hypothetical protein
MLSDVWSDMVFHVALSTWIAAGLLVGSCVLLWVSTHVPAVQRRLVVRASSAAGLGLPQASEPMVRAAQVRRVRGFSGGGVRLTVTLSLAAVGVLVLLPRFRELPVAVFPQSFSLAVVVSGLAVAALAAFEIGGRLLVARPQTTPSEEELAWDDALRSAAILDLVAAAFLLGAFGAFFGIQDIAMAVRGTGGGLASVEAVNLFGLAVLGAGAAASVLTSSRRHFRRTLHADAAAYLVGPK